MQESTENRHSENQLLASLSSKDSERLLPHLETLTLFANEVVQTPGEEISYVYFPIDSIVVLVSSVEPQASVEVGLIGSEGLVGAPVLMGVKIVSSQALVLSEGKALRLPAQILIREAKRRSTIREALLPYAHALLAESAQLAACHRYHTPQARLARVLLAANDRRRNNELKITQNTLAHLLGTRRATVTEAANQLEKKGLIQSSRGKIGVVNREGLQQQACSCYRTIAQQYSSGIGKPMSS